MDRPRLVSQSDKRVDDRATSIHGRRLGDGLCIVVPDNIVAIVSDLARGDARQIIEANTGQQTHLRGRPPRYSVELGAQIG
jgi:hypothetical protein